MMMMVMAMMMIVRMKGEMQISAEASLADVTHGSAHLNLSNHPLPWSPGDEEYDHDQNVGDADAKPPTGKPF